MMIQFGHGSPLDSVVTGVASQVSMHSLGWTNGGLTIMLTLTKEIIRNTSFYRLSLCVIVYTYVRKCIQWRS